MHEDQEYPSWIYYFTFFVSLSGISAGFATASIGPSILYIPDTIALSTVEETIVMTIALFGALPGLFFSGILSDKFGRRPILISSNILGALSAVGMALSQNPIQLIAFRFISGISMGAVGVMVGLILAETSPSKLRGQLQGYGGLSGWIGGLVANIVAIIIISLNGNELEWRYIFLLSGILYFISALAVLFNVIESPRWLVSQGREEEAISLLQKIYGPGRKEDMQKELISLEQAAHTAHLSSTACITPTEFSLWQYRKPLLIAIALQILQQLSGNNIITVYSSIIMQQMGLSNEDSVKFTTISILTQIFTIWFIVHTLDQLGRKRPLMVSLVGTGLSLFTLAIVSRWQERNGLWLAIIGIFLNRVFYSIGLGPIPSVLGAEILPFPIRGRGLATAMTIGEIIKIVIVTLFLPISRLTSPSYIYAALGIFMFAGFIYTVTVVNETKGSRLDLNGDGRNKTEESSP